MIHASKSCLARASLDADEFPIADAVSSNAKQFFGDVVDDLCLFAREVRCSSETHHELEGAFFSVAVEGLKHKRSATFEHTVIYLPLAVFCTRFSRLGW